VIAGEKNVTDHVPKTLGVRLKNVKSKNIHLTKIKEGGRSSSCSETRAGVTRPLYRSRAARGKRAAGIARNSSLGGKVRVSQPQPLTRLGERSVGPRTEGGRSRADLGQS